MKTPIGIHHTLLILSPPSQFFCFILAVLKHCLRCLDGRNPPSLSSRRQVGPPADESERRDADLGLSKPCCRLGASVRSTPPQELSVRHPATLWALFSAILLLLSSHGCLASLCLFLLPRQRVCCWLMGSGSCKTNILSGRREEARGVKEEGWPWKK